MLGSGWNCCCCNSTQKAWKTETTPNQWNHWNLEHSKIIFPRDTLLSSRVPHSIQCLFSISFAFFPVMGRYRVIQSSSRQFCHEQMPWWPGDLQDLQDPQVTPSRPKGPNDFPPPRWVQLRPNGSSGARPPAAPWLRLTGLKRTTDFCPWTNHFCATKVFFFRSRTKDIPKNACHHKWELHSSISVVLVYWLRKASMMALERFQFGHCSGIIILRGETSIYVNLINHPGLTHKTDQNWAKLLPSGND